MEKGEERERESRRLKITRFCTVHHQSRESVKSFGIVVEDPVILLL